MGRNKHPWWGTEEIKEEIKKYLETNDNKNTTREGGREGEGKKKKEHNNPKSM